MTPPKKLAVEKVAAIGGNIQRGRSQ